MPRLRLLTAAFALAIASIILPLCASHADPQPTAAFKVEVADIDKSADLLNILRGRGVPAVLFPKNMAVIDEQNNRAVWIGRNVPLGMVRTTLQEALKVYPLLSYFYVVGDRGETPPEKVHNTIHIGGSIEAVLVMKLNAIDRRELLQQLTAAKTIEELHNYLREKNAIPKIPLPASPTDPQNKP